MPSEHFQRKKHLNAKQDVPSSGTPCLMHPLCKVEQIDQHDHGKAIVDHDCHQIVDRGDQRARSDRRVDMDLMEQHRDQRAHQTGNDHGNDQRQPDTAGQQKGRDPDVALEKVDVAAQKAQGHHSQNGTVQKTHAGLLPEQLQFFGKGQVFIHQHTDGNSQRLGTNITGHIPHHGLEADDHRQYRHHRFKRADDRGDQHPEEQQCDQPRETLFHAFKYAFVQIFLAGKVAKSVAIFLFFSRI